jgi:hypothetical protein
MNRVILRSTSSPDCIFRRDERREISGGPLTFLVMSVRFPKRTLSIFGMVWRRMHIQSNHLIRKNGFNKGRDDTCKLGWLEARRPVTVEIWENLVRMTAVPPPLGVWLHAFWARMHSGDRNVLRILLMCLQSRARG